MTTYLGSVASQSAMLALTGRPGDWAARSDLGTAWVITGSDPSQLSGWTQWSYRVAPRVSASASSGPPTPNADTDDMYVLTALAAGATFGAPTGSPANGQNLLIRIKDNGTARSLAWNAIYRAIGVALPTTTAVSKTLYVGARYNSADTKWDVIAVAQEA